MNIQYIFRHKAAGFNSIENVFGSIYNNLEKKNNRRASKWNLPFKKLTVLNIYKNIRYCFKEIPRGIKHITGDVHYICIFFPNSILTIHDIHSSFNKNFLRNFIVKVFWYWIPCLRVKYITTISETSAEEIRNLIPFAKHKIKVIPNPVSSLFQPKYKEFNSRYPIILQVGTKANKNLKNLILALAEIKCRLVIVGQLSLSQKQLLIKKGIDFVQYFDVSFTKIIQLYEHSDIVSFISTYEGFGMPIIEAQAIGRPVITSNISAMPEVAGDGAYLVNPFDVNEIKLGISEIILNSELRKKIVEKGFRNVKKYNVETIVLQYLSLYKNLENTQYYQA